MIRYRILYLSALVSAFLFYLSYQKWFSWIVLLTVLLVPWFSLLMSLRTMLKTHVELDVPASVRQGTGAKIRLSVSVPGVPAPVHCRMRIYRTGTGKRYSLAEDDTISGEHCGGFTIQCGAVRVYDYLCLFARRCPSFPIHTVLVRPQPMEMPVPAVLERCLNRGWRAKPGGGYSENHEIRPWMPGDTMQRIHWKLSVKTDSLMIREPVEPVQGPALLLTLQGTPEELDRKYSRFLWLGEWLCEKQVSFTVLALTGRGTEQYRVDSDTALNDCLDALLSAPYAGKGAKWNCRTDAAWRYEIGGDPDGE